MLEKLFTLIRSYLANRTIDGIVGELEKKVSKLASAESTLAAHADWKAAIADRAKAELEAFLLRTAEETKVLAAKIEQSRKTREKLSIVG